MRHPGKARRWARLGLLGIALAILWSTFGPSAEVIAAPSPAKDWAQAQAEEARTLRAELAALRESLSSSKANTQAAKSVLHREIDGLAEKLTRLRVDNERLEQSLPARERERSDAKHAAALDDLLTRMHALLDDVPALPPDEPAVAMLPTLVERIFTRIEAESTLRLQTDGNYFDVDGRLASAPILHVGRVAAIRWDEEPLPLVSSPDGLRAVEGVQPRKAEHGRAAAALVVLHDPRDPPQPGAFANAGWRGKMDAGGPIMWVLLGIGIIALLIVVERVFGLTWARQRWRAEQRRFEQAVRQRKAATLLDVKGWIAKPLIIAASARCPSCATEVDTDVEERATQALMVMRERLLRRLSLVNVAAGVAPLLGLLGTVTGMIHTFSVVTDTGTSEPQQLAAGISQALLTTQFGLAIAIPAFLAHALLSRGARRILASAEQTVLWYLHGAEPLVEVVHEDASTGDSDAA